MGVLSDIIIADPGDAASINAAAGAHLKRWECLESKGIDTIQLGTLSQILANRSVDDINTVASFMMDCLLHEESDEGPWVYQVPDQLHAALAALSEDAEEPIAEQWAATEEFKLARVQPADVEDCLHGLVLYARKARDQGKSLLLWMCL